MANGRALHVLGMDAVCSFALPVKDRVAVRV
jgi:hypothetical protein